jgi:hypothetical protein
MHREQMTGDYFITYTKHDLGGKQGIKCMYVEWLGFRGVVCGPEGAHLAGGCVLLKLE